MAVSAAFILYRHFSSFLTRDFSSTGRFDIRAPKFGSVGVLAGFLAGVLVGAFRGADVSIARTIILLAGRRLVVVVEFAGYIGQVDG